jgi:hypothetical protein
MSVPVQLYMYFLFFLFYQSDDGHVWPKHEADLRTKYIVVF